MRGPLAFFEAKLDKNIRTTTLSEVHVKDKQTHAAIRDSSSLLQAAVSTRLAQQALS